MTITVCRIGDGDSINLVTIIKSIYLPNDMQKCNIKLHSEKIYHQVIHFGAMGTGRGRKQQ